MNTGISTNQNGMSAADYSNNYDTPVKIQMISNVKEFAFSYENVLALTNDGNLWAWGNNAFGELGIGIFNNQSIFQTNVNTPTEVLVNPNTPTQQATITASPTPIVSAPVNTTGTPMPVVSTSTGPSTAQNNDSTTLPTGTPSPSPGFDFNEIMMFGYVGIIVGLVHGMLKRKK
jgi:Regulator of chromosome condensation (RCC1) repeat